MKFSDLRISTQLKIGMGAILVLVVILGSTAWLQTAKLWQNTQELYEHPLHVRRALNNLDVDILTMHRDMKDLVMADNEQERKSIILAIDTSEANAIRQFDILYERYLGPRKDIDEIRRTFLAWKPIRTETIRLARIGKVKEALRRTKVGGAGGGQVEKLQDEIQDMINGARERADKFYADARNEKDTLKMQLWIFFGAILLLILGVSYVLLKNISDPLKELTSLAEQFGQGKLDARSRYVSANEFGALAASFNMSAATIQSEWLNKESAARLMETLRESNAYLENLINYANAPIIVWDPQFRITRFNHAFELLTGSSEVDVIGQALEMLFPPALAGDSMALIRKTMTGERWDAVEIKILHRDQSVRTVLWNSATLFSADGKTPIATIAQGQDITERKQAEEELRRSHDRFTSIITVSNTGAWEYHRSTNYLWCSSEYFTMLGRDPGAFVMDGRANLQETWVDIMHPDDCQEASARFAEYLSGGSVGMYDSFFRMRRADGQWAWIWSRGRTLCNSDGSLTDLTMGTHIDITERKQAEEAVKEATLRLSLATSAGGVGVWDWDCVANILVWDDQMYALYGITRETFGGAYESWRNGLHPGDVERGDREIQTALRGEKEFNTEFRVVWPDGAIRHIRALATIIRDADGKPLRMIGTNWDITTKKLAEEALRESEEKHRQLIENSHDIIYTLTADGIFTFVSPAWTVLLGHPVTSVVGHPFQEFVHPDDMPGCMVWLQKVIETGKRQEGIEYRARHIDGTWYWHTSSAVPLKGETVAIIGFEGTARDITERKQAEEEVIAKNKELENYLYIASHDLRSPLVNIQGFSRRLQKQVDSINAALKDCTLPPATKAGIDAITGDGIPKTLNFIFSSVTKMDVLLNGLLHLSRTGRTVMAIKEIDINQLFQTIIVNFNFQLTQLGAIVTAKDLPSCYGDENLLNQLFSNIIGNATKYYDRNRGLVIEVTARNEFQKVIYSIRDNGLGIEPRNLEKIWDIFYRIDSTLADAGEGLGLSIVKRIAEKHKGRVWVESEIGKGSVFYIELQANEFTE